MARYIVIEATDTQFGRLAASTPIFVNDISEFHNDEVGIGQNRLDVMIIDTHTGQFITSDTCEWRPIETY